MASVNKTFKVKHGLKVASGNVTVSDTTDSSSTTTGALTVAGGVGIAKQLHVGGTLNVTNASASATANVTGAQYGTLQVNAGNGYTGALALGTAGSKRWQLQKSAGSESGSNAGSDLELISYTDAAGYIGTPLTITRATGTATFSGILQAGTSIGITSGPTWTNDGGKWRTTSNVRIDGSSLFMVDNSASIQLGGTSDWSLQRTGSAAASITGSLTVGSNLTVTGNLTINGTTTTVNSTTVTVDDPIFTLGGDTAPTVDDNKDRGIEFRYHNGTSAKVGFFGYDDSAGVFTFIPDATNTSEVFSGTAGDIQATNGYLDQIRFGTTSDYRRLADYSNWGYSSGYKAIVLGSTSTNYNVSNGAVTLSFNYDPANNTNGAFSGNGSEILFRNGTKFLTPNTGDTGFLWALTFNADGSLKPGIGLDMSAVTDTATTASHYFVETATDGFVRPKTLANVRTEVVTTAAVNAAAATTVGTVTSGTWQGSTISATYIDSAIARLASPALTGTPTAPTATAGTNTTQIATTAFVTAAVASGGGGGGSGATVSDTAPSSPSAGDQWIDSTTARMYAYIDSTWVEVGPSPQVQGNDANVVVALQVFS